MPASQPIKIMNSIIKSNAKLNLYLRVTEKKDGYHLLESIFAPIKHSDIIYISESADNQDKCTITTKYISPTPLIQNNTVLKALSLMRQKYEFKQHFNIEIEKNIPIGAGLAGGSSNAATIISWLVKNFNLSTSKEEITEIAKKIGADVPFFIHNKPSLVKGIGEIIFPIELSPYKVIIVYPMLELLTKDVFNHYSANNDNTAPIEAFFARLEDKSGLPTDQTYNSLISPACSLCPEIEDILNFMQQLPNCILSSMTGSGSTCFALFDQNENLTTQLKILNTQYPKYFISESNIEI